MVAFDGFGLVERYFIIELYMAMTVVSARHLSGRWKMNMST